jgi:hypothetical protein
VRTGLAFTGVAVALIGVGVLLVAFSFSSVPSGSIVEGVSSAHIGGGTNYMAVIPASIQRSASVVYAWSSTRSLEVYLYVAAECPNMTAGSVCPAGPALKMWWADTGVWSWTGAVTGPWLLLVVNPNSTEASYNSTLVESYPAGGGFGSGWNLFVLLIGSTVLIGIGALALFLGLFLRGGVYGPPRPPVGQPDAALLQPDPDELDDETWDDTPSSKETDVDEP